jgi:hypothetical protein
MLPRPHLILTLMRGGHDSRLVRVHGRRRRSLGVNAEGGCYRGDNPAPLATIILTGDLFQHLSVRWKLLHEHQQPLNGFFRFVSRQSAADEINLLELPRL